MIDPNRPATEKQIKYAMDLFRKVKLYYQCQTDESLIEEVLKRTGFDLNNLTHGDVNRIVEKLVPEAAHQRKQLGRQWRKMLH